MSSPRCHAALHAGASPEIDLLLQVLRGEPAPWPAGREPAFERRFLEACADEGVAPLLQHVLSSQDACCDWPATVGGALARAARTHAATDMLQERELVAVLSAFAEADVRAIVLKGAALAYTHYPEPALRTRCDADVLIQPRDLPRARRALERRGYDRRAGISGSLVSYEECHAREDGAVHHVLDLHWQVNNRQVFANALGWDEAHGRSVPIPQLGPCARTLCPPHALLLACMHRAGHLGANGGEGNRLIWLYDIELLANAMTAEEWRDFVRLCAAKSMRRIALDALERTREAFATSFPADVTAALAEGCGDELSAAYLDTGRRSFLLVELRGLGTWKSRATLLRERLFPPASYLRARYRPRSPSAPRWLLPWWYARRAAEGMWKAARS